jgi:hypothetical protein
MEESERKQRIAVDKYRNHPPKKKHTQLIRMIFYLILSLAIGWYLYFHLTKSTTLKNTEDEGIEVEIEL